MCIGRLTFQTFIGNIITRKSEIFSLLLVVLRVCFWLWLGVFLSIKGVVCVCVCVSECVCVCGLLCACLPAMPLPEPDVPASQRLALDCRTLLDHRIGKGK